MSQSDYLQEQELRSRLAQDPTLREPRIDLAWLLLKRKDLAAGWHYLFPPEHSPKYMVPPDDESPWIWRGENLEGKTLLIYPDQGFGDLIQFFPLIRALMTRGAASVVCQVPRVLQRLFQNNAPARATFISWEQQPDVKNIYGAHYYCAITQLPALLAIQHDDLPLAADYLSPSPADIVEWQKPFANVLGAPPAQRRPRIGLVWQGNPTHARDSMRSMPLDTLRRMLVDGIDYYSLQIGHRDDLSATGIVEWADQAEDFADSAGRLHHLDGVLAVDTAIVHLACAMGKPTMVLLDAVGDWRWQDNPSAWYPRATLIRQHTLGDWESVGPEVQTALQTFKLVTE